MCTSLLVVLSLLHYKHSLQKTQNVSKHCINLNGLILVIYHLESSSILFSVTSMDLKTFQPVLVADEGLTSQDVPDFNRS
jgi:hypothetical protein